MLVKQPLGRTGGRGKGGCFERVKDRDGRSAGVAEDVFDAEIVESSDERLCAVHFLVAHKNWG